MIIGVDLGNKNTKTKRDVFVSGVKLSGVKPPLASDVIQMDNRYFSLSDERINYTREKIEDENFLVLLLMAICREIKHQGLKKIPLILNWLLDYHRITMVHRRRHLLIIIRKLKKFHSNIMTS